MAIPAKRFEFLSEETNVSTGDFYTAGSDGVLNSPNNAERNIDADMDAFFSNIVQTDTTLEEEPNDELLRSTKDASPDIADLSDLSPQDLMSKLSALIPGDLLALADLNQMSNACKSRAASRRGGGGGRRYGQANDCNGTKSNNSSKCDSNKFGGAMNKASRGAYSNSSTDRDGMLSGITSLSSMGYDMDMCGVFGALSSVMPDTGMLSKASGSLLGELTANSNVLGMMDLASSSGALHTKLVNPSSIKSMLSSFKLPKQIKSTSGLTDRFTGALELFDGGWDSSSYDGMQTTSGVRNPDMGQIFRTKSMDNIYDSDSLDMIPTDDAMWYSAAF